VEGGSGGSANNGGFFLFKFKFKFLGSDNSKKFSPNVTSKIFYNYIR